MFLGHLKKKKKKEDTQSGSENLPATTKKKSTGSINFSPRGIFSLRSRLIPAQLLNIVANNLRFPSVSSSWGLRLRQGKEVQLFGAEPGGQKPPTASENTQEGRNRVFKREGELTNEHLYTVVLVRVWWYMGRYRAPTDLIHISRWYSYNLLYPNTGVVICFPLEFSAAVGICSCWFHSLRTLVTDGVLQAFEWL